VVGPLHWVVYPALACLVATWILGTPVRFFTLPMPEPIFPFVLAFAWPLIRPSLLGPIALFVLGMFTDFFHGGPAGLWTLSLLGVYALVLFARPFIIGQEIRVLLAWYVGATSGAFLFAYLFVMLDVQVAPSLMAVFLQLLPTLLLFPLAAMMVDRFDDGDVRFR
jgi:rod shape-determining protein MreD